MRKTKNIKDCYFKFMKMPEYSISEEYEDDPHWNSGFWETTILFKGGEKIKFSGRKDNITPSQIAERYRSLMFEEFWEENEKKYKEMAWGDFLFDLDNPLEENHYGQW